MYPDDDYEWTRGRAAGGGTTRHVLAVLALWAVVLAIAYGVIAIAKASHCEAQWRDSSMASRWQPVGGCLVRLATGRWVPAQAVRAALAADAAADADEGAK